MLVAAPGVVSQLSGFWAACFSMPRFDLSWSSVCAIVVLEPFEQSSEWSSAACEGWVVA